MMARRYGLGIWLAVAVLLLTACGGPAAPGADPAAGAGGERTIRHALGETKAPANPQRVVVLDTGALVDAIALGVKPVGAALFGTSDLLGYLGAKTEGIKDIATSEEPNIEAILALQPDLIIGSKDQNEKSYQQLAQVAPTVLAAAEPGAEWKAYFRFVAEALNRQAEAERLIGDYEARVAEFQRRMGDRLAQTDVSIFRSRPEGVDIYSQQTFAGTVVREAGLSRPPGQDNMTKFSERISVELIPRLDADVIFWVERNEKEAAGGRQFREQPLWGQLEAVKAGRAHRVSWDVWVAGWNITGANLILDDLFTYLVEGR